MNLLDADLLREWTRLSTPALGFGIAAGLLLWLFGWRWHRFWVVLTVTIAGGMAGLKTGQIVGGHALAFGLLLAICAGLLALELARLVSFLLGGLFFGLIVQSYFPDGQERWLAFLVGGLLAVLLYRLGTMTISSFAGSSLILYGAAALAVRREADLEDWTDRHRLAFHSLMVVGTIVGIVAQGFLDRCFKRRDMLRATRLEEKIREAERERVLASIPLAVPEPKKLLERLKRRSGD